LTTNTNNTTPLSSYIAPLEADGNKIVPAMGL